MAKYLVGKRLQRGVVDSDEVLTNYAGEVIELDPKEAETGILMERGYLTPVPDNYDELAEEAEAAAADPEQDAYNRAIEEGYSEKAAKAISKGHNDYKYVEEERQALAEKAAADAARETGLAERPRAEAVAEFLNEELDAVLGMGDDEYNAAVALLPESDEGQESDSSSEETEEG